MIAATTATALPVATAQVRAARPAPTVPTGFADVLQRAGAGAGAGPGAVPGLAGRTVADRALLALGRQQPAGAADPAAFVAGTFDAAGVAVPADTAAQAALGAPVASLAEARTGDLVVLAGPPTEVGIYAGRGRMVHAPADGGPVRLSDITAPVAAIRRIVTDPAPPAAPAATAVALLGRQAGLAGPAGGADLAGTPFAELFQRAGAEHGVEPALLAAVARAESGFDPAAVSPAGAQGLMQFMPGTAASLGVDPSDPASAINGAARYLRQGLDRFGTVELALAAYNAGPGAVQRHGGIPPFRETQDYVRKVLDLWEQYRR